MSKTRQFRGHQGAIGASPLPRYNVPVPEWTVERMTPDSWERVRTIRLRALAESPDAFGTTVAEWEGRPPGDWRERLEDPAAATFLAVSGNRDRGIVACRRYDDGGADAGLFGMWVEPDSRARGIGGALVDAVVAWARDHGFPGILLDVADTNPPAIRLYESRGFSRTGVTGSLPPPREHILEHQRGLRL